MAILEAILFPIIWLLTAVLEALHWACGSYGLSIIALSLFVAIATYPLTVYGRKIELRSKVQQDAMSPAIKEAKAKFRGEERFNAIEAIYKEHNYHPIMSIAAISGFALQLPFLLSSLVLLIDYPALNGQSFQFIDDLSKPDGLLDTGSFSVNILPIVMSLLTLIEAMIKPEFDPASRRRFSIVAIGLLVIVYPLPAAVVLYWLANNVWSLTRCVWHNYSAKE